MGRASRWYFTLFWCLVVFPRPARAQWAPNGNGLCVLAGDQSYPVIATDGGGGAFVVWADDRSGPSADLYLQHITSSGAIVAGWTANGNPLCTVANDQRSPATVSDGAGGVYVTWEDDRAGAGSSDIYLQRITSSGAVAAGWPVNGLAVCTAVDVQASPVIALESGAAIVAWQDGRSTSSNDIYAQKVSAAGVPQWTADGVAVCTAAGGQTQPAIVGDNAGGALVVWQDTRAGITANVYVQRLNASGIPQWTAGGASVCSASNDQINAHAIADAAGGAIVVWDDYRSGNGNIYAQRMSGSGVAQWAANGVALCTDVSEQFSAPLVSDGAGGAIVPWSDFRLGTGSLYAQKISAAGVVGWQADGAPICAAGDISDPVAAPDGTGGAFFVWDDARAGGLGVDLYAVRFTSAGALGVGWTSGGSLICNAAGNQLRPVVTMDATGSVITSWFDDRNTNYDVFAKRLALGGSTVDVPPASLAGLALSAAPNPMVTGTMLRFTLDVREPARLEILDLGGRVVRVVLDDRALPAGPASIGWDGREASGASAPAGLYWARLATPSRTEVRKLARLR